MKILTIALLALGAVAYAQRPTIASEEDFRRAMKELSNWGRWGADDELGAANLITPVVVRDDTGAQIATDTISLSANGHLAFTLATDKYPVTANIRGTLEFDTPSGSQIGALGIRIPAVTHTFTTLPALARQAASVSGRGCSLRLHRRGGNTSLPE